jgi:hypothetical protein
MMVLGLSTRAHAVVTLETDDNLAMLTGTGWAHSTAGVGFYGTGFEIAQGGGSADTARFTTQIAITSTATWCIQARWTAAGNHTAAAKYQVFDGTTLRATFTVNQQANGGAWRELGCVTLTAGKTGAVQVSDTGVPSGTFVVADAVRWVWDERPLRQDFCVAINGGFGSGGDTFVGKEFTPTAGECKPWAGVVKAGSTVELTSTGAGCLSDDGVRLTLTLHSQGTDFLGPGVESIDYIELCPKGSTGCPVAQQDISTSGGILGGTAAIVTCTAKLSSMPSVHD